MNTTTVQDHVLWESESGHRGTWSIVISCISTLTISLWSALHLSIPQKRETWIQNLARKLGWAACGLLLPEWLIFVAANQLAIARIIRNKVNAHFEPGVQPEPWYNQWFRKHPSTSLDSDEKDEERTLVGHSSNSSKSSSELQQTNSKLIESPRAGSIDQNTAAMKQVISFPDHRSPSSARHRWTLAHGFYAAMGGFAFYDCDRGLHILSPQSIFEMLEDSPALIPDISTETIHSMSKSDGIAKSLLVMQLGWFCISSIGRVAQHLPLTLLEVSTLTHALCAVVVYVIWWHKPLNITEPLIIVEPASLQNYRQWDRKKDSSGHAIEDWPGGFESATPGLIVAVMIPIVYGAPHLVAWNSYFATNTEQLLWRISASVVTGSTLLFYPIGLVCEKLSKYEFRSAANAFGFAMGLVLIPAYFCANLFLIAESLRQLFHLPPAAFQTTKWGEYFPHI